MRRPFRFWMTGCAAVVMAGLASGRGPWAGEAPLRRFHSRYDLAETEQRIFTAANECGYGVFARVCTPAATARPAESLIVFRAAKGGTPVWMAGPATEPSLPLSMRLRQFSDGATDVQCASSDWDLPPDVVHDVAALRRLLADALA